MRNVRNEWIGIIFSQSFREMCRLSWQSPEHLELIIDIEKAWIYPLLYGNY